MGVVLSFVIYSTHFHLCLLFVIHSCTFQDYTISATEDFSELSFTYSGINITNNIPSNTESCLVNYNAVRIFVNCANLNQSLALILTINTFDGGLYIVSTQECSDRVDLAKVCPHAIQFFFVPSLCP